MIYLFIRTEKSVKEFVNYYPIVSCLVIIHFAIWIAVSFSFGEPLFQWGAGHNLLIHEFGQYWRFITPVFLHIDFGHVLFNSFALVLFGPALEQMLGKYKFIIAYLLAGLAGNIGTYIVDPTSIVPHIGASGAIYGLYGIYIFMVLFRKHLIDQGNAQIILIIFVLGLIMTFVRPGINVYAHVFGFIGGFALGPLILTNAQPFSIYRNQRPQRKGTTAFNPNRWQKRRIPRKLKTNIFWIILGIIVLFGLLGRFF